MRDVWRLGALLNLILLAYAKPGECGTIRVFLDTDAAADVDDVGAIGMLHALADLGQLEVVGMTFVGSNPFGPPCVAAINTYYGRANVPVGTLKEDGFLTNTTKYNQYIAENWPNPFTGPGATEPPDAVAVTRRVLAAEADSSVHFVAIGPLLNLANLLRSGPDAHSPLAGRELVARKVATLYCMGGAYPSGREWNLQMAPEAAEHVASSWPTPVVFSGFEIGIAIETGASLVQAPDTDPQRKAYELYLDGPGRSRWSWDQTALLYAVRGKGEAWELSPPGWNRVNGSDGSNAWSEDPSGQHRYMLFKQEPQAIAQEIEDLMLQATTSPRTRASLSR